MTKSYFYPQSIYTVIAGFSEIFNDLSVRVYDKNNSIVGIKPVPLSLSPKEKIVALLSSTDVNDVDPQVDNYLPRITISPPNGFTFASARMRGKNERRLLNIDYDLDAQKRTIQTDVQGTPYDLTFEVTIWVKYLTDGLQLVEYLVPYFAPERYISYKERNFGLEHKSKVTLNSVSPNFVYELGETERRVITWTLGFTVEDMLYKPMELTPEITCVNITIAGVPCKRIPVYGDKIGIYEPVTNGYESTLTKENKISLYQLDASDAYDEMVKYWRICNTVMDTPYNVKCVTQDCDENLPPKPTWDPVVNVVPCTSPKMLPCITIDPSGNIINYWQDEVVGPDNIIRLVSYKRVYDYQGNTIFGPEVVENDTYPTSCVPIYTAPITSAIITSSPEIVIPYTPPITSTPIPDPCVVPPDYITTASSIILT